MTRAANLFFTFLATSFVAACVGSLPPGDGEPAPGDDLAFGSEVVSDLGAGDGDLPGTPGLTPVVASLPHAAWGAGGYLSVWVDERHGATEVYGTRMRADGEILDPQGIPIALGPGELESPRVAFDGERYLVVWTQREGSEGFIRAARVSADGKVLDRRPILIAAPGEFTGTADVASTGDGFLVVWDGACPLADCAHGVSGALVDRDGNAGPAQRIASPDAVSISPAVAKLGAGYYVVWVDARSGAYDLYARRITAAGAPTGSEIAVSIAIDQQVAPSIASSTGDQAMVVWQDSRYGAPRMFGARIFWTGAVMDPAGIEIAKTSREVDAPAVAAFGGGYAVVWTEAEEGGEMVLIRSRLLDSSAMPLTAVSTLETPMFGRDTDDKHPAIAAGDDSFALVWQGSFKTATTVYGCRLDAGNVHMDQPQVLAVE